MATPSGSLEERTPLRDLTNRLPRGSGSDGSRGSPEGYGSQDPFGRPPGQFDAGHDFFSTDELDIQLRPKPSKADLDRLLASIETQVSAAQGNHFAWSQLVFQYDTSEFNCLEQYLVDLHAQRPMTAEKETVNTVNRLMGKVNALSNAYRFIGQDPSFPEFKAILARMDSLTHLIVCWRAAAASNIAILSGGRMPAIETSSVEKEAVKLYNFVKFYAKQHSYRVGGPDGFVYIQDVYTMPDGRVHKTPHWRHVTRVPQPGTPAHHRLLCMRHG